MNKPLPPVVKLVDVDESVYMYAVQACQLCAWSDDNRRERDAVCEECPLVVFLRLANGCRNTPRMQQE